MKFNFKDTKSAELFAINNSTITIEKKEDNFFINSIAKNEEIIVSSNPLEREYLEILSKKSIKKMCLLKLIVLLNLCKSSNTHTV